MSRRTLAELRLAAQQATPPAAELIAELESDLRKGAQLIREQLLRRIGRAAKAPADLEPMLQFEREATAQGFLRVAGIDEAGRGPLAGPIVASAVILAAPVTGINDSKQLTYEEREAFLECLQRGKHSIGTAIIEAPDIDRNGIQVANYRAMAQAAAALRPAPDYLLIDGFSVPGLAQPQRRIVKGDSLSQSIAAASVVAKVTRDRMMLEYDKAYPEYGFAQHKGYGTRAHLDALEKYGPCPIHRMSFAPLSTRRETGDLFEGAGG